MATKSYCSAKQKSKLVELVTADSCLMSGKFSSSFSYKDSQKRWEAIAEVVNSIPSGTRKDWRQWRKTWQDIRSKTKIKEANLNRCSAGTGGGPSQGSTLTKTEETILSTMSAESINGDTSVVEGDGLFDFTSSEKEESVGVGQELCDQDQPLQSEEEIIVEYVEEEPRKERVNITPAGHKLKAKVTADRLQASSSATVVLADVSQKKTGLKDLLL